MPRDELIQPLAESRGVRDNGLVGDATAHYKNLVTLGRDEFLTSAAPAVLVRSRAVGGDLVPAANTMTLDADDSETVEHALPLGHELNESAVSDLDVYPLAKKPGASFPDRITIGRTPNNDITIADPSISRLHAYVRHDRGAWLVADGGSKNGSWLDKSALAARKERKLTSKMTLRLGDVDLQFYLATDLYTVLGGRP